MHRRHRIVIALIILALIMIIVALNVSADRGAAAVRGVERAERINAEPAAARSVQVGIPYCIARHNGAAERACIIRVVFRPAGEGRRAVKVAWCESTLRVATPNAPTDEYGIRRQGLYQFGKHERRTFGYGTTALAQARGALAYYRYERRSGRSGWGPWTASRHCWG